jgi:hypothetical protein
MERLKSLSRTLGDSLWSPPWAMADLFLFFFLSACETVPWDKVRGQFMDNLLTRRRYWAPIAIGVFTASAHLSEGYYMVFSIFLFVHI